MKALITDIQKQVMGIGEDQQINVVVNYFDDNNVQVTTQVFTLPQEKWESMTVEQLQEFVIYHGKELIPQLVARDESVTKMEEKHTEFLDLVNVDINIK